MKLSYGRPAGIDWTITGTWSVAFLLDAAGVSTGPDLSDGDVQVPARFAWRVAAPSIADYADIKADLPASITVGFAGFTGVTLPVGTLIEIRNGAAAVLTEMTVIDLPEGGRCAWALLPAPTLSDDIRFRIKNSDAGGATVLTSGQVVDIGEAWVGRVRDVPVLSEWEPEQFDPSTYTRGAVSSLDAEVAIPFRRFRCRPDVLTLAEVIGGENDWQQLMASINRGQRCVVVPRISGAGMVDSYVVSRTAIYGMATAFPKLPHVDADYFLAQSDLVVDEDPAPPA